MWKYVYNFCVILLKKKSNYLFPFQRLTLPKTFLGNLSITLWLILLINPKTNHLFPVPTPTITNVFCENALITFWVILLPNSQTVSCKDNESLKNTWIRMQFSPNSHQLFPVLRANPSKKNCDNLSIPDKSPNCFNLDCLSL